MKKFYEQLSLQLEGLWWKDGGPAVAVQVDNETTDWYDDKFHVFVFQVFLYHTNLQQCSAVQCNVCLRDFSCFRLWVAPLLLPLTTTTTTTTTRQYLLALQQLALHVGITPAVFAKTGWPAPSRGYPDDYPMLPFFGGYMVSETQAQSW